MKTSKYILLEGIQYGNKFITTNNPTEPESEKVKLADGTVAYIILGYADSIKKAQDKLRKSFRKPSLYKHKEEATEIIGWIIKTDKNEYYSLDKNSGGYPCWTSWFQHAEIFPNKKLAISVLENDPSFNRGTKMSNGTKYPPRMVHIATGVNNNKLTGVATISVVPIILGEAGMSKEFTARISKTG